VGQIALAWVGQLEKATSPVVGVNSIKRLKVSIMTGIVLTPEEVAYLEAPSVSYPISLPKDVG
jgi:aryl-alcohol dehydrogenase-like predicted oxidoreductase